MAPEAFPPDFPPVILNVRVGVEKLIEVVE